MPVLQLDTFNEPGNLGHVFVTPAGEVDDQLGTLSKFGRQAQRSTDRVCGFERTQNAFGAGQQLHGFKSGFVGDAGVLHPFGGVPSGMLRANARVIQARGAGMDIGGLSPLVLKHK